MKGDDSRVIEPPGPIGLLGGGQLGRMFILAAKQMGYRVHVLTDAVDSPAAQVADEILVGGYDDIDLVARLAQGVRAVTVEFENVSAAAAEAATKFAPLRPSSLSLAISQHRLREKTHLASLGVPVTPFRPVNCLTAATQAEVELGTRGVLKTASSGYDGKGQIAVKSEGGIATAWQSLDEADCIYEQWVDFEAEVSMIAARNPLGEFLDWGLIHNEHASHILDVSTAPTQLPPAVHAQAREIARTVAESLNYIGVLCLEFFVLPGGSLMVNEIAPRPHNSGHLTIEACHTSQFEQQLRAVCGLPLGDTTYHSPAAMANLLGDVCIQGPQNAAQALLHPNIKLHWYGKQASRPGRKMGHLTALAATSEQAREVVLQSRSRFSLT